MALKPYYQDDHVTLYLGDMRRIVMDVKPEVDCVVTDPPYGETGHTWDRWPVGWPSLVASVATSMWCFGSMRMFLDQFGDFTPWRLSQDIVWDKGVNTGMRNDRFSRSHEHAVHWYRGQWRDLYKDPQREGEVRRSKVLRATKPDHFHAPGSLVREDDGTRLVRSVMRFANLHGRGHHPTEKPVGLLDRLIRYSCRPGGTVLDPFAGSGSTAAAAILSGRKAILIEGDESYCEVIVKRLQQQVIPVN